MNKIQRLSQTLLGLAISSLFSLVAHAQAPEVIEVSYQEVTTKIRSQVVDEAGNSYYAGVFKGALIVEGDTLAYGQGGEDYFLMKKSSLGTIEWTIPFGSDLNDNTIIHITWLQGHLYLHFGIPKTLIFQNQTIEALYNPGITWVTMKLNSSGNSIWAKRTNYPIKEFHDIAGGSLAAIYESAQGLGDLKIENETVYELNGQRTTLFTKFDSNGTFINFYSFVNTFNLNSRLDIIVRSNPGKNQLFFLLSPVNSGAQTGNNQFNLNGTIIQIQTPFSPTILVKTDTSLNVIAHKILNPSGAGFYSGGSTSDNRFQLSDDSTSLHLFANIGSYTLDGFNENLNNKVAIAMLDTNLVTTQLKFIFQNNILVNCQHIQEYKGAFYVFGTLNGKLATLGGPVLPVVNETIQFGNNGSVQFDINGVHKSFILKLDKNLNYINHTWIGDHTVHESQLLSVINIKCTQNSIYFLQFFDNTFNPWELNLDLQLVKGGSKPMADQADFIQRVAYFPNKSKLILGLANGITAFDKNPNGLIKTGNRRDFFYAVIDSNQNVLKYDRVYGSMGGSNFSAIKQHNGKLSFILSLSITRNRIGFNYYRLEDDSATINSGIYRLFITIDSLGNLSSHNFENTPIGPIIDFDYFDNGDLAVITSNNAISYNLNGLQFPGFNGFYIARMNPAFQITQAIKFGSLNFSQFFARQITVIKGTNDFQYLTSNYINPNGGNIVSIVNSRGGNNSNVFSLSNPLPNATSLKYYHMLGKSSFSSDKGVSLIGPFSGGSGASLAVIEQRAFLTFSTSTVDQDNLLFNESLILPTPNASRSIVLGVDNNNKLKYTFISPETAPLMPPSMSVNIKSIDNFIYLSGGQSADLKFGALNIMQKGEGDGIILKMDTALNMVQYYRVASVYSDLCTDIDVYRDSSIMIAFRSQGSPTPTIGLNQISTFNSSGGISPSDLEESGYVSQLTAALAPSDFIFTIKNGSWHDATIWNTGNVPKTTDRVFVRHKVQILENAACHQIFVDPGADLKVGEGILISLTGKAAE